MATKYNGKFVNMLDDQLELFPDHWPVLFADDTLDAAMRRSQFTRGPDVVPRSAYNASLLRNKQLRDRQGNAHQGGVYEFTATGA